jgi:phosphonate transport system substrate-binding protein
VNEVRECVLGGKWRLLFFILLTLPGWASADTKPLRIGILPTLSPRVLLKNYSPLREYLEEHLQQPVQMWTATDFRAFHEQTMAGEYDLVVTAAHFARLAQREAGWRPLATYKTANRAILLMSAKHPISSIEEIRGKTIASVDPLALVVTQSVQWLAEKGLRQDRDYRLIDSPSFNTAAYAVQEQEAVLAIISPSSFKQLPKPLKSEMRVFQSLPEIPALIWMAPPQGRVDYARLKAVLLGFSADSTQGRQFFEATAYTGMRPVSDDQMQSLDAFADSTKNLLNLKHER